MRGLTGEAVLLRIFIGEADQWHGRPLYSAVVEALRREGLAGATVLRGVMGFGAHSIMHKAGLLDLSADLPVVIEVVDSAERIDTVLPVLNGMLREGLVTLEKVQVIRYDGGK
jgi:uncharacterized protein